MSIRCRFHFYLSTTPQVPFPAASAIFVSVNALLTVSILLYSSLTIYLSNLWKHQAATGVSSSYDSLVDLFECLANFLKRLEIYTAVPVTPLMSDIIVKIMVELLSVLALATKQIKQGRLSEWMVGSKS